ncbi:hypothetical protein ND861_19485, partial [Leptospira sp. 2 VSF19]|uniref:Uncharacterized protein n=1 Tax=Leptospira soteropolitanensis TaxID=2950025 RepID=A0AAW5VLL2_9LEPT|nr:hypothetical protein [Leptospira soteropolitanensis]MCW7494858.1 hypothetical protein [Leptospira soteropolitanensis]MCW7502430.1 hypothetical protein [Leptospira soteropolitanensis]MCW7524678.1 hypothetical protein [Leptospira soteropolitanensis]MCW7528548.1 hypothetical protein [Leptospira soteropolitanensis]MCW7532401.1 hypothetical protein [Leptospira soteropolitanensis]
MKTKTNIAIFLLLLSIQILSEDLIKQTNKFISKDNKYRIETSYSESDPDCKNQLGAIFDLPRNRWICQFNIKNIAENKIEYSIKAGDFESGKQKCYPPNFELGIGYGFDYWTFDNKIVYTEHSGWFSANELSLETYEFDWKKCNLLKLGSFEFHPLDYDQKIGTIYFLSSSKKHYILFHDGQRNAGYVGELKSGKKLNINEFFNFNKKYIRRLNENVEILFETKSENIKCSYSFPIAIAQFSNQKIKIDLINDKIEIEQ